ncbi:hypothetical protein GLYMA_07G169151v4 [Glycine max]|nr:hypothetical protein GLYMA_07G169151v4 [Glycine max]KAH1087223.1 hypothetical protein GYH30_018670 [Glycine max]
MLVSDFLFLYPLLFVTFPLIAKPIEQLNIKFLFSTWNLLVLFHFDSVHRSSLLPLLDPLHSRSNQRLIITLLPDPSFFPFPFCV